MAMNYLQPGDHLTLAASPYAVESGQGVLQGKIFGIASGNAESGAEVVVAVTGVFALDKVAGESFAVGADVYYNTSVFAATSVSSGNARIGVAVKSAGSADTTVECRLVPQ